MTKSFVCKRQRELGRKERDIRASDTEVRAWMLFYDLQFLVIGDQPHTFRVLNVYPLALPEFGGAGTVCAIRNT